MSSTYLKKNISRFQKSLTLSSQDLKTAHYYIIYSLNFAQGESAGQINYFNIRIHK